MRRDPRLVLSAALVPIAAAVFATALAAQPRPPDNVRTRHVDLWSDGTRISGDLFHPADWSQDQKRPAIVMSHGWGGTRAHLNAAYAPFFAAAGFMVLTIDYRGWGDSDSKLVIVGKQPAPSEKGEVTVTAHAVREVVDPFDQTEDIRNAITFIQGEPGVDAGRIGLWGSSYSGGHVIWVAAHDPRVKATVSQVGSMDSVAFIRESGFLPGGLEEAHRQAVARARGEAPAYATSEPAPGLQGTPDYTRIAHYSPRDVAHRVQAAALIIDAENEELFDIRDNGRAVYAILKNRVPAKYHVVKGATHYDVYRDGREEALELAIDWFEEHL